MEKKRSVGRILGTVVVVLIFGVGVLALIATILLSAQGSATDDPSSSWWSNGGARLVAIVVGITGVVGIVTVLLPRAREDTSSPGDDDG